MKSGSGHKGKTRSSPRLAWGGADTLRLRALRREDFLVLDFELINLRLDARGGAATRLVRARANEEAFVVVHFPPQHVIEEALIPAGNVTPDPQPPLRARLAGPTRLVFKVPDGVSEIPATLEGLLDFPRYEPAVAPTALPRGARPSPPPRPAPPTDRQTAVEAPYRLILSPDATERWDVPRLPPVVGSAPVPIWQAALRPAEGERGPATVRAIWTRDRDPAGPPPGYVTSLRVDDRNEIVDLSADFGIGSYLPSPIEARRMELSALGARLDLEAIWEPPLGHSLVAWQHSAAVGRDQAVTVVRRYHDFVYGFRFSVTDITRRVFLESTLTSSTVAVLIKQTFLEDLEQTRSYDALPARDRRAALFRSVTIAASKHLLDPDHNSRVFWPTSQQSDLEFHLVGVDWDGKPHPFSTPLLLVANVAIQQAEVDHEFARGPARRRETPFDDQVIAFAESSGRDGARSDAALPTAILEMTGRLTDGPEAPSFPFMKAATVRVQALEHLAGGGPLPTIAYHATYLDEGLGGANIGEVFAELVSAPAPIALRADQAGGLGVPRLDARGLSRRLGPVGGDLTAVALGSFPGPNGAQQYLEQVLGSSKILGILPLADLIRLDRDPLEQVPRIRSFEAGGRLMSTLVWQTALRDDATLDLSVSLTMPLPGSGADPSAATYSVEGTIEGLTLKLIPGIADVMTLHFERLHFSSGTGQKTTVAASIALKNGRPDLEFIGPLSFLQQLRDLMGNSLSTPPGVEVRPSGVTVAYSLGIPTIAVGIFSLQHVAILASLELPFSDSAPLRLRFAFCERHRPFLLTVSFFGGGGFVGLELTPRGLALLEASLEFGAAVALDLGVASGGVHVMAGIYFRLELQGPPEKRGVELTGYFRCGGSLEVLGLIRISVEFYLGLTWRPPKAWGKARLTVEVEIVFFSTSVSLEVERQFSGSASDPLFSALVDPDEWREYVAAFA